MIEIEKELTRLFHAAIRAAEKGDKTESLVALSAMNALLEENGLGPNDIEVELQRREVL